MSIHNLFLYPHDILYISNHPGNFVSNAVAIIKDFTFPKTVVVEGPWLRILFISDHIGGSLGFFLSVDILGDIGGE